MYMKVYKCIAHYIAKVVAEEEKEEGNLNPTNYTRKIQTNKQMNRTLGYPALRTGTVG